MTEPRLCRDCRWAVNTAAGLMRSYAYDWKCDHPSSLMPAEPPSLVDGSQEPPWRLACGSARKMGKDYGTVREYCGPEGRFWEPIEIGFGR